MSITNFEQIINLKVKITTLLDQTIIGYIYTFSSSNEIIVIRITSNQLLTQKKQNYTYTGDTYRILNTAFIKSIQVLPPFPKRTNTSAATNTSSTTFTTNNGLPNYSTNNLLLSPLSIKDFDREVQKLIANYNPQSIIPQSSPQPEQISNKVSPSSTSTTTSASKKSLPNKPHHHGYHHHHGNHHHHHSNSIGNRLNEKLCKLYGKENVKYNNHNEFNLFNNEIKLTKPFTLGKANIHKLKENASHLESIQRALKQFWLEIDLEKKGG